MFARPRSRIVFEDTSGGNDGCCPLGRPIFLTKTTEPQIIDAVPVALPRHELLHDGRLQALARVRFAKSCFRRCGGGIE